MKTTHFQILTAASLAFFLACGGSNKALITQSEIDSARQSGTLSALYDKATKLISESGGSSKKEAIALQSKIAGLLTAKHSGEVEALLSRDESAQPITRSELLSSKSAIADMQQWSATDYTKLASKLDAKIAELNKKIKVEIDKSELPGVSLVDKVLTLKRAALLAGTGEPETLLYETEKQKAIEYYQYEGSDGLQKGLYNTAMKAAESGLMLDEGNLQFESMLSQAQAGMFQKDFSYALENGKPESAYLSLMQVADKPIFLQLKKSMGTNMQVLANYFAGSAAKNYQKEMLDAAYNDFRKGRDIQEKLGISNKGFIQEKRFLDLVMARAKNKQSGVGKRQALLRVIQSFDPNYPRVQSEYNKLTEEIRARALTKLSVDSFKEVAAADPVVTSVGRRIGSKLEKYLFENLGNEVLIVAETNGQAGNGYQGLNLKVDGEVLQAAIETKVNKGQRSQQVQIGVDKQLTEAYQKWSKRKRGEAPKQYIENPIMDEVILTVEHIRKQAIAEVAFRIIEPSSGKILLTDNYVKEAQYSGESINEFKKGDFHQPYLPADMPTDIKIMDSLASELALTLGEKLGTYLAKPEEVFYRKANESKARGNLNAEIELLANAVFIAESKGVDSDQWLEQLKELSLR
ncbi:hypothetical protein [Aliikangiella sp. G2MR2-5]|uniref:hypothetical protein n=1 Tax=Aliikangiella sp. G2MR2-5 TaxID=2788943 RepID=UPI0018AB494F|nr:hypothetical protein [Aliikangiella sp. G2MR2-5]